MLHNEYVTWQKRDQHSKAYLSLLSADGKRIGKHLGIEHPERSDQCLVCHSVFDRTKGVPAPNEQLSDGVGCEGCHGAASGYLKTHTEGGATHQQNLLNGLADIVQPGGRARMCVSCHVGDADARVTHRIMGAGHPRMTFELDTFGIAQPHHWRLDPDYEKRKGRYLPARAWFVGQAVRARQQIVLLNTPPAESESGSSVHGVDLASLSCLSCHHALGQKQFRYRDYQGRPGELRYDLSSLLMVAEGLAVIDPSRERSLRGAIDALHAERAQGCEQLLGELDAAISLGESKEFDTATNEQLFTRITTFGSNPGVLSYEVAEQVAMAISALDSALDPGGKKRKLRIDELYKTLASADTFDGERTASAVRRVRG